MIREKTYDVTLVDGSAVIDTHFINGYIENFCIGRDRDVRAEIIYQGPIEIVLFSAWIQEDTYLPLRVYARDCDNKKLAFSFDKFAANGKFRIYLNGSVNQQVRVSVSYSTEMED